MKNFPSRIWNRLNKRSRKSEFGTVPKSYIKKFLPRNPVIVEAGAHIGIDTLEMAKIWPSGMIYAFEPIPHLFSQLEINTRNMKNIKCFPVALSHTTGSSTMYVSGGSSDGSSSLLSPKEHLKEHPDVEFLKTVQVNTITLDSWAKKHGITHLDFLWLDIQGHELSVLRAAQNILKTIRAIYTEVHLVESYEGGALYPELRSWLESYNFRVEREALPWPDGGNVFFVKPL